MLKRYLIGRTQCLIPFFVCILMGLLLLRLPIVEACEASRKAVDEYLSAHDIRLFLSRIDDHAVVGMKS